MRKFGKFMVAYLGVLLVALCTICTFSCDKFGHNNYDVADDSVWVADQIEATVNPLFSSVEEVQMFQARLVEEYFIDEIFRTFPPDILKNVSSVCFKRYGYITKRDIVNEYQSNRAVYDNLPKEQTDQKAPPIEVNLDSTDLGNRRGKPISTNYRYETDSTTGKKIIIKEERRYDE